MPHHKRSPLTMVSFFIAFFCNTIELHCPNRLVKFLSFFSRIWFERNFIKIFEKFFNQTYRELVFWRKIKTFNHLVVACRLKFGKLANICNNKLKIIALFQVSVYTAHFVSFPQNITFIGECMHLFNDCIRTLCLCATATADNIFVPHFSPISVFAFECLSFRWRRQPNAIIFQFITKEKKLLQTKLLFSLCEPSDIDTNPKT